MKTLSVSAALLDAISLSFLGAGCGSNAATANAPSVAPTSTYALEDVATHKDASSCWTVVNDKVYDVTAWIGRHPGGQAAIMSMCGKDATAAFTDQHGGERRPENELASFQIGNLKR